MKQYTMINPFTKQMVIVTARNGTRAKRVASELVKDEDNFHHWTVKQDYHDVKGFEVVSA